MLVLKLAFRNLARHTKRTLLLGVLICVGTAFLFFSNALFESTNKGLETAFIRSLTGDVVIGAGDGSFGLFGNEVPIVSTYESIPAIAEFGRIRQGLDEIEHVAAWTPIVSAAAYVEVDGKRTAAALFGVETETYFNVCKDIVIEKGSVSGIRNGGIFLNSKIATMIEKSVGRKLEIGDQLQLSMYSDGSFRIRKASLAGIHRYTGTTQVLDRIVLADPELVRSIANYTMGYMLENSSYELKETVTADSATGESFDMDNLFSSSEDVTEQVEGGFSLDELQEMLADSGEREAVVKTDSAAWSFILLKADTFGIKALEKALMKEVSEREWGVRVLNWRLAAGLSAQAIFALQYAFYIGMVFIAIGAVLVIMNALVISVLERSPEIGTMRGIGAGKGFIRKLFIAESMILVMTASVTGIVIGIILSFLAAGRGIRVENELLINLFGGNVIKPLVTAGGVVMHICMAFLVGALAWVYPVTVAIKIQPVTVMGKD